MSRMNIEFNESTSRLLDEMTVTLDTTKAGAIRFGLHLLSMALKENCKGNALGVVKDQRVLREIVGPWSDAEFQAATTAV